MNHAKVNFFAGIALGVLLLVVPLGSYAGCQMLMESNHHAPRVEHYQYFDGRLYSNEVGGERIPAEAQYMILIHMATKTTVAYSTDAPKPGTEVGGTLHWTGVPGYKPGDPMFGGGNLLGDIPVTCYRIR